MDNVTGSLANWGVGKPNVVEQKKHQKLTKEELEQLASKATDLNDNIDTLYSLTFVKELNDCRMHVKSLLASLQVIKRRFDGN